MEGLGKKLILAVNILFLVLFLPVILCISLVGNGMDYYDGMKLTTLLPNQVLAGMALAGICGCAFLFRVCRKIVLTRRGNVITDFALALLFTLLYFVNVQVAKETAFLVPWDIMVVRKLAYDISNRIEIGYFSYLSMYSNNIPISYILGMLLRKAGEMEGYSRTAEFIWLQTGCALVSIGGMFACLTVKKVTKNLAAVAVAFLAYLVLVGMSPWKIVPYTDIYGIVFPVMGIYFYVCRQKTEKAVMKYFYIVLAVISAMAGGFVKPSVYIVLIGILAAELLHPRKNWRTALTAFMLAAGLMLVSQACKNHIIGEIGLDYNPEVEASWQNYFYMGLNEDTTGGYNSDDASIFGEFQTSKKERNSAALERAVGRLEERGFWGSLYFWLRKMVMTFNDGIFGWASEVWIGGDFPEDLASHTVWTQRLRDVFWPGGSNMGGHRTLCQLTWIFCMMGIPGLCVCTGRRRDEYGIFVICCLGVFLYQMLFEARARYLLVFLPLLISASVCGIARYGSCLFRRVKPSCRPAGPGETAVCPAEQ